MLAFTFSAATFSRRLRGEPGFPPWGVILLGAATALAFFFTLRVLDEHKDAETDRRYRPELPVPRGLISAAELRSTALVAVASMLVLNAALLPTLLPALAVLATFTAVMSRDFFLGAWLRPRLGCYMLSHMLVMPLIDLYTTGLDWALAGAAPSGGLWLFLGVTYANGVLLEIGRKVRAPAEERPGVDTYSAAWGHKPATAAWLGFLTAAVLLAISASRAAGDSPAVSLLLATAAAGAAVPAARYARNPSGSAASRVAEAAALWTLAAYLLLGLGSLLPRG